MTETTPAAAAEAPATAPAAPAPHASPGALLRTARERAGLSVEDLAGQLKLAKNTLEALERDDFAALSEPVYVRGYYRKVAKVLPIAEADLIGAYNARNAPAPTTPAMRRIPLAGGVAAGTSRQYRGQGLWMGAAALVVVVLLFTLTNREPPKRLAETQAAPTPVAPVGTTLVPAATGPDSVATQPPAPAATVTAPAAAPAAADAPPAVPNQLVLDFREASFVRIEDNRARTLAIGLVRGGERQALDGQPPYTVFLGNAQNVKVFFGGVPVDFTAHINAQNDTARFTVP